MAFFAFDLTPALGAGGVASIRRTVASNAGSSFAERLVMTVLGYSPAVPLSNDFIVAYGEAMLEWSYVENRLYRWFSNLTGMSDAVARGVFFSARSFAARSEMLSAVVATAPFKGATAALGKEFIGEAVIKATGYTPTRNAMAHGLVMRHITPTGTKDILVQGKVADHLQSSTGLTIDSFRTATKNFEKLANIINGALRYYRDERTQQLQACVELLAQLPSEGASETLSRRQLGRQRQRQSAQRGKSRKK